MDDETKVVPASEEQEEEVEQTEEREEGESLEEFKARLQKAEELAENYKRRAEKAEKKAKTVVAEKVDGSSPLSAKDYLALSEAGITALDYDEVQDFANYRKIPIAEALQSSTLKTILAERKEERMTAQATATKGARGTKPKSGEDYLEKARTTGELPTDDKAMQELILAKQNSFRKKR